MLVEGHQDQGVGGALELLDRLGIVAEQGGDPDLAAGGLKGGVGFLDQAGIGRQGGPRQVFQVEDVAGVAMAVGQGD